MRILLHQYVNPMIINLSGSGDNTIKIWNINTNQCEANLQGHGRRVTSVCTSNNNKYILSGLCDLTIKIWNINTNQCEATLRGHGSHFSSVCQECYVTIRDSNGELYYRRMPKL